jgi:hypothetical protein
MPTGGTADWLTLPNKPLTFPPSVHNHDALYRPITWNPNWVDIVDRPQQVSLEQALESMGYLPIPQRTTTEINAIVVPADKSGIVLDKTLGVYKLWNSVSQTWAKIVITSE